MKFYGPPRKKETLPAFLLKYKRQFFVSSLAGFLYNTTIVLGPVLLGRLIDAAGGDSADRLLLSALSFVGVTASFQFLRFVKRWYMRDQFNRVACDLRQTLLERLLGRSVPELSRETAGDLMSRTLGDITLVVDTVMSTLNEGWDTWLLMISYFAVLMIYDWRTTLAASVMIPAAILFAHGMRRTLYDCSLAARRAASSVNTGLKRYLDGVFVLRLFGRESSEADRIEEAFEEQAKFSIREILLQQVLLPVYALIAGLGIVAAIGLLGARVAEGEMTVGELNAYLVMFVAFSGRTKVAARVFNRWHGARAAWGRVREKMERSVESGRGSVSLRQCRSLNVEGLSFSPDGARILSDISFSAERGKIIGITGPVGSGKTALARALSGLFPYEGSIRLDGRELRDLSAESRAAMISSTGHEQFLFSMSIRENILLGTGQPMRDLGAEYDEARFQMALRVAALSGDISRFEEGVGTMVGEKGIRISGGQRQRIALARALYAKSDILLLDDPFSAVDIVTEREIVHGLREACAERIVLLFTHRLTAFPLLDGVLVMKKGSIGEQGSHETLMAADGLYGGIYSAQVFMEGNGDEKV